MSENSIPQNRICNTCLFEYPLTNEYFRHEKSGFRKKCRECERLAAKQYYHDNKQDVLEKKRLDRLARPEVYRARDALRIILNPEKEKLRWAVYRDGHKEERYAYTKQWKIDNADRVRGYNIGYYADNKEREKQRTKIIYILNTPVYFIYAKRATAKRRARILNAEGSFTNADIDRIFDEQEGRCRYCGITLFRDIPGDMHIDHIQPLSRGGSNWPENIALACQYCNCSKSDKTLAEWMDVRGW